MAARARGQRLTEILKQGQYRPLPVEKQILIIFAGTNAYLDDLPVEACRKFEEELYQFAENTRPGVLKEIREKKKLDDDLRAGINSLLKEFKERFAAEHGAVQSA